MNNKSKFLSFKDLLTELMAVIDSYREGEFGTFENLDQRTYFKFNYSPNENSFVSDLDFPFPNAIDSLIRDNLVNGTVIAITMKHNSTGNIRSLFHYNLGNNDSLKIKAHTLHQQMLKTVDNANIMYQVSVLNEDYLHSFNLDVKNLVEITREMSSRIIGSVPKNNLLDFINEFHVGIHPNQFKDVSKLSMYALLALFNSNIVELFYSDFKDYTHKSGDILKNKYPESKFIMKYFLSDNNVEQFGFLTPENGFKLNEPVTRFQRISSVIKFNLFNRDTPFLDFDVLNKELVNYCNYLLNVIHYNVESKREIKVDPLKP